MRSYDPDEKKRSITSDALGNVLLHRMYMNCKGCKCRGNKQMPRNTPAKLALGLSPRMRPLKLFRNYVFGLGP